ncbi:MAG TPA: hypothetical protein VN777_12300 [Terriglobales bacterium]|nr:hypothetical protein [Terriglobales bacterium]
MKTGFCKGTLCKATLAAAVACLTLVAASPAQAAACSNASLKGQYGQTISGQILPGNGVVLPQNGVAMTNFDGNGKFTQVDFVVIDGTNQSSKFQTGETGTYKVNSDCTGNARINYKSGGWIDLELVVVNQGREFRTVVSVLNMGGNNVPANIGSSGMRVDSADEDAQTATK